ncbi:hypothetical protein AMJ39_02000 [candidate division TA06 bacterium DG_24]|uniref:GGDEF domain-containing protein n=3 Tax=Bacteria division TA06 TaxID=1156500 RepID=A0A0S8JMS0_UNCT6|nr:MAG: hypothetical protein AMJ39_02000 [candidate division TA06 bacterium DG_24]KPK69483.1 MAG: hypothetical protein AMJ82_05410 [candidate division TA06 bacterium SM23_40]KPL10816.1 MAG: hypothetical protein AMJ71_01830 [candidate division TA06 bacterium SM1_40]
MARELKVDQFGSKVAVVRLIIFAWVLLSARLTGAFHDSAIPLSPNALLAIGCLYGIASTFLPLKKMPRIRRDMLLVAWDTVFATAITLATGGVASHFYPVFFILLFETSILFGLRETFEIAILVCLVYLYTGLLMGWYVEIPKVVYLQVAVFSIQCLLLGVLFALLVQAARTQAQRAQDLSCLYEVSRVFSSTFQLDGIVTGTVRRIASIMRFDRCAIILRGDDEKTLLLQAGYDGTKEEPWVIKLPLELARYPEVQQALETKEPVIVSDPTNDPIMSSVRDGLSDLPLGSIAVVPLVLGTEAIGTLSIARTLDHPALTDNEINLCRILANQTAIAIEKARLFEQERRRNTQLAVINEINRQALSTLEQDILLHNVAEALRRNFNCTSAGLYVLDRSTGLLTLEAFAGPKHIEHVLRNELECGNSIAGHVSRTGSTVLTRGSTRRDLQGSGPENETHLFAPIKVDDGTVGVIALRSRNALAFSDGETSILEALSGPLANAIQNAQLYERARQLSISDTLTDLYNSRYLFQALDKELARADRYGTLLSVVVLDIDHFQMINDRLGRPAGDQILKQFGRLLPTLVRDADFVARYGGEEFVILMPETPQEEATIAAQRICSMIAEHRFRLEESAEPVQITVSAGVAAYPGEGTDKMKLLHASDLALYSAKRLGTSKVMAAREQQS